MRESHLTNVFRQGLKRLIPVRLKNAVKRAAGISPEFDSYLYRRLNERRLEHLAALRLNLANKSVLEVGAGVGDLTGFFLDRGCRVLALEGRPANLQILRSRHPALPTMAVNLDHVEPGTLSGQIFDIVHCYGLLYHLARPEDAIAFMSRHCRDLLLLETCVSMKDDDSLNACSEPMANPTQALSGQGCRPTRRWVIRELKRHFTHVYVPRSQPTHEQFPTDWATELPGTLTRAVFVASRVSLANDELLLDLPVTQVRL